MTVQRSCSGVFILRIWKSRASKYFTWQLMIEVLFTKIEGKISENIIIRRMEKMMKKRKKEQSHALAKKKD